MLTNLEDGSSSQRYYRHARLKKWSNTAVHFTRFGIRTAALNLQL
jgi:hypothetical protein